MPVLVVVVARPFTDFALFARARLPLLFGALHWAREPMISYKSHLEVTTAQIYRKRLTPPPPPPSSDPSLTGTGRPVCRVPSAETPRDGEAGRVS